MELPLIYSAVAGVENRNFRTWDNDEVKDLKVAHKPLRMWLKGMKKGLMLKKNLEITHNVKKKEYLCIVKF